MFYVFKNRRDSQVMKLIRRILLLLLLSNLSFAQKPDCGVHCGTERWPVKTLSDSTRSKVNFAPVDKTVHELRAVHRPPGRLPAETRSSPIELITFRVKAVLIGYKAEADLDFHVVIGDLDNPAETMIAEIPNVTCAGVCSSGHLAELKAARANLINLMGPASTQSQGLRTARRKVIVEVVGVGFFDFDHGQIGRAPNNLELHPVLSLTKVE